MTEPLISIIVPVYRVESYLSRCVDSLLAQTYQNLEIILVDDGSPDQCPQICEDYAKKEERIHVIHQENRGLSGARNAGIDVAKGEYLAFVDSDDYVSDDYIQVMYDAIKATGCAISQCRFIYTKGEKLKENRGTGAFRIYRGNSLMEKLYGNEEEATWFVVAWNKLYRRELFETIRYPEGRKYCRRTRSAARIRCSLTASQPSPYSVSSAEPCSRSSRAETISYTVCSTV